MAVIYVFVKFYETGPGSRWITFKLMRNIFCCCACVRVCSRVCVCVSMCVRTCVRVWGVCVFVRVRVCEHVRVWVRVWVCERKQKWNILSHLCPKSILSSRGIKSGDNDDDEGENFRRRHDF